MYDARRGRKVQAAGLLHMLLYSCQVKAAWKRAGVSLLRSKKHCTSHPVCGHRSIYRDKDLHTYIINIVQSEEKPSPWCLDSPNILYVYEVTGHGVCKDCGMCPRSTMHSKRRPWCVRNSHPSFLGACTCKLHHSHFRGRHPLGNQALRRQLQRHFAATSGTPGTQLHYSALFWGPG